MPSDADASSPETADAISSLVIEGFKSLAERTEIEIRPLTLLAGANSSGKSSALQPLLLLKQTLESPHNPESLRLSGPNVRFTSAQDLLSALPDKRSERMGVEIRLSNGDFTESFYDCNSEFGFRVVETRFRTEERFSDYSEGSLHHSQTGEDLLENLEEAYARKVKRRADTYFRSDLVDTSEGTASPNDGEKEARFSAVAQRGFLYLTIERGEEQIILPTYLYSVERPLLNTLHVPGLRDNPSRTYETTAVGNRFPGTFDDYVASVIHSWEREDDERLEKLVRQLQHMGLTGGIEADRVNDTQVELRVEQQPVGSDSNGQMINVADVGIGVSQVLPVLVACLVADEGQLVYIEQPEIHLHPRAQTRLADALVEAANRGVRVVVETHSQLLLLALQTRIAEDEIDPEDVMLHWFERRDDGVTEVNSRAPDDKGAFGDWPEDFSEVEMEAENRYLDAAEKHLFE